MEVNYDEELLVTQRIDPSNEQDIRSQILRIAIYDEFKAYENYTAILEKFGNISPFVQIREAEARHYSSLILLLEKYKVEVPINNWIDKIEVPNSYIEACELGVAGEIRNIAMYENLLKYVEDKDIEDALYKLQAASYNNHLPAFRNCVVNYYNSSISQNTVFNQEDLINKLSEYQNLFDDLMSGNIDQNKIGDLFSKLNISMIGGAAFGAALIAFLNTYTNKNKE